jgi:TM2 domain-containing membrane protein YozV
MRYCTKCGAQNDDLAQYCAACQTPLGPVAGGYQPMQAVNQAPVVNWQAMGADKKLAAGLCGILIGGLGVHKFILGYTTEGIIEIVITFFTCGLGHIIGLIEGIIYLTKSDEEFVRTYIQNKKGWF